MSRTVVTFNGVTLTNSFKVSDLRNALLPRNIKTAEVAGRDGTLFTGVTLAPRSIGLTLTVIDQSMAGRQAAARTLASALAVSEPKPLSLSVDGGLYYMAIPVAEADGAQFVNAVRYEVIFECPDPVAYGEEKTVVVPSGGSKTIAVGGTYPTKPLVTTQLTCSADDQYWMLSDSADGYLSYAMDYTGTTVTHDLAADCEKRILTLDSNAVLLAPSADWLELTPGAHTLTLSGSYGTHDTTIKYRERWL